MEAAIRELVQLVVAPLSFVPRDMRSICLRAAFLELPSAARAWPLGPHLDTRYFPF